MSKWFLSFCLFVLISGCTLQVNKFSNNCSQTKILHISQNMQIVKKAVNKETQLLVKSRYKNYKYAKLLTVYVIPKGLNVAEIEKFKDYIKLITSNEIKVNKHRSEQDLIFVKQEIYDKNLGNQFYFIGVDRYNSCRYILKMNDSLIYHSTNLKLRDCDGCEINYAL